MTLGEELARVAKTWIGVPFLHRGTTRRGCDCTGLLIGCLKEIYPGGTYDLRKYPHDWNLHGGAGDFIREALAPIGAPTSQVAREGDILIFRFGRCFAHCGILVQRGEQSVINGIFVHAHVRAGKVETGTLRTKKWLFRLGETWRIDQAKLEAMI